MNKLEQLYRLSNIVRYAGVSKIHHETVAEHSFHVASIVILLYEDYIFDLGRAVSIAIVHDWPEAWVGDVLVTTKREYPDIAWAIKNAEDDVVREYFSSIQAELWHAYDRNDSVEAKIVHLADVIQCIQYANHEIALGNIGYMSEVVGMSKKRKELLLEDLHEHKR